MKALCISTANLEKAALFISRYQYGKNLISVRRIQVQIFINAKFIKVKIQFFDWLEKVETGIWRMTKFGQEPTIVLLRTIPFA